MAGPVGRHFYDQVSGTSRRNRSAKREKEGNTYREVLNNLFGPSYALFLGAFFLGFVSGPLIFFVEVSLSRFCDL